MIGDAVEGRDLGGVETDVLLETAELCLELPLEECLGV